MTNFEVDNLLRIARERDFDICRDDARSFLAAKKLLQDDPSNAIAKEVVTNFLQWMNTGIENVSFAPSMLPMELIHTDEENEGILQRREAHLAAVNQHA